MARVARLGLTLMVVGMMAAAGLGVTYSVTRDRIEQEEKLAEARACMAALPGVKDASEIEEAPELTKKVNKKVPEVRKVLTCGDRYIMVTSAKGYGGPVELSVGISADGKIEGISVVSSRETSGLGSKVLSEENLEQFNGRTGKDPLEVGEDVQAVTGATITSKSVALQARKALEAFEVLQQ